MKFVFVGVEIDNLSLQEVKHKIIEMINTGEKGYIVTPNASHVVLLQKDKEFKKAYENASLVLADGMPIIWVSRILGQPLKEKISGSDIFPLLCRVASQKDYKVFLLGAGPGIAKKASEALIKEFPNLKIVGTYSPLYNFQTNIEENKKINKIVNVAAPDILFVGLGAPKQEKWIYYNLNMLNIKIAIGVGAAFDFIAGAVKRAPKWMQKIGLEWFFRLIQEPKRMWRRYLIGNSIFIWLAIKEVFKDKYRKYFK
jgi:N-acetylglucosaminyldiphosphoundecaprenol N-acetyl-beta-D-mannosaminyltransferase